MVDDATPAAENPDAEAARAAPLAWRGSMKRFLTLTAGPIVAAFVLSAVILLLVGVNPLTYYGYILERSLFSGLGLEQTATRMAPLLFLCASLIVAFRAGIWNLGTDGQFLLGAVDHGRLCRRSWLIQVPASLDRFCPSACCAGDDCRSVLSGRSIPALLKAYQGVNEIVTTLDDESFLGVQPGVNVLIKMVLQRS